MGYASHREINQLVVHVFLPISLLQLVKVHSLSTFAKKKVRNLSKRTHCHRGEREIEFATVQRCRKLKLANSLAVTLGARSKRKLAAYHARSYPPPPRDYRWQRHGDCRQRDAVLGGVLRHLALINTR